MQDEQKFPDPDVNDHDPDIDNGGVPEPRRDIDGNPIRTPEGDPDPSPDPFPVIDPTVEKELPGENEPVE